MFLEQEKLQAYYGELDQCVETARDRLVALTAYCNQGFDGELGEAVESVKASGWNTSEAPPETVTASPEVGNASAVPAAMPAVNPDDDDVFEALRKQSVEAGILTEVGRQEGWVAFHPCPFYGRFVAEIVYPLNDALRRLEGRLSYFIAAGRGELLRWYCLELKDGLTTLGGDLDGIIAFCKRKVV